MKSVDTTQLKVKKILIATFRAPIWTATLYLGFALTIIALNRFGIERQKIDDPHSKISGSTLAFEIFLVTFLGSLIASLFFIRHLKETFLGKIAYGLLVIVVSLPISVFGIPLGHLVLVGIGLILRW